MARILVWLLGVVFFVVGLHWIGQGTGTYTWPANPVMDNNIQWAWYGGAAALVGVAIMFYSRRLSR
ncbi:MAG: hypothetical protein ABSD74_01950 [Rhizomicrobium sp.]|jgi:hypothetical protein